MDEDATIAYLANSAQSTMSESYNFRCTSTWEHNSLRRRRAASRALRARPPTALHPLIPRPFHPLIPPTTIHPRTHPHRHPTVPQPLASCCSSPALLEGSRLPSHPPACPPPHTLRSRLVTGPGSVPEDAGEVRPGPCTMGLRGSIAGWSCPAGLCAAARATAATLLLLCSWAR